MKFYYKIVFLVCTFLIAIGSCQNKRLVYVIPDSYTGPGIVFIKKGYVNDDSLKIDLDNGLGVISKGKLKYNFVFVSKNSGEEIDIIPVGKEDKIGDNRRHIFSLFHEIFDNSCVEVPIEANTFFVGTKKEYLNSKMTIRGNIDTLLSKGYEWCDFYNNLK